MSCVPCAYHGCRKRASSEWCKGKFKPWYELSMYSFPFNYQIRYVTLPKILNLIHKAFATLKIRHRWPLDFDNCCSFWQMIKKTWRIYKHVRIDEISTCHYEFMTWIHYVIMTQNKLAFIYFSSLLCYYSKNTIIIKSIILFERAKSPFSLLLRMDHGYPQGFVSLSPPYFFIYFYVFILELDSFSLTDCKLKYQIMHQYR